MFIAWVVFHVIVCIALVLAVLMQASKGEGLAGSAFGGGGGGLSGAVFGGRGATSFLQKATTYLAVVFFLNCLALALLSSNRAGGSPSAETAESVVTQQAQAERQAAMERQQQQQQQAAGDTTGGNPIMQITPTGDSAGN